jgi:hypothetical protein
MIATEEAGAAGAGARRRRRRAREAERLYNEDEDENDGYPFPVQPGCSGEIAAQDTFCVFIDGHLPAVETLELG